MIGVSLVTMSIGAAKLGYYREPGLGMSVRHKDVADDRKLRPDQWRKLLQRHERNELKDNDLFIIVL